MISYGISDISYTIRPGLDKISNRELFPGDGYIIG